MPPLHVSPAYTPMLRPVTQRAAYIVRYYILRAHADAATRYDMLLALCRR